MSAPPQAITPNPHNILLKVYTQIANEMGFQQQQQQNTSKRRGPLAISPTRVAGLLYCGQLLQKLRRKWKGRLSMKRDQLYMT
jgi:hypothetical protein